jgi:hypothetical protein
LNSCDEGGNLVLGLYQISLVDVDFEFEFELEISSSKVRVHLIRLSLSNLAFNSLFKIVEDINELLLKLVPS